MENFVPMLEEASEILRKQPLLRQLKGTAIVSGDLHGDLDALKQVIQMAEEYSTDNLVLLGDYVDRGPEQVEVVEEIANEIISNSKFTALRGNHEDIEVCKKYGFTTVLFRKNLPKSTVQPFFSNLPYAAISSDVFMMHGGIPINQDFDPKEIVSYERSDVVPPGDERQLLWNDPIFDTEQSKEYRNSPRGSTIYEFGKPVTTRFLEKYGLKRILRAHTYLKEGSRETHDNKVLSLFTSCGGPYTEVDRKVAHINLDNVAECEVLSLNKG